MSVGSAIFIIIGNIIGAGFATGKEIVVFYARYGYLGLISAILSAILFYYFFFRCMNTNTRRYDRVVDWLMIISMLVIGSTLFGATSELSSIMNSRFDFVGWLTILITIFLVNGGIDRISIVCKYITPILILIMVVTCFGGVLNRENDISMIVYDNSILKSVFMSIAYVGMNTMLSIKVLRDVGDKVCKKNVVAQLSSFIFAIVVIFSTVCIMLCGEKICMNNMPILDMALTIGKGWMYVYIVALWLAIITSLICIVHSMQSHMDRIVECKLLRIVIIVFLCYLVGLIGFDVLVEKFYPIIGMMGVVYTLYITKKSKRINMH